MAIITLLIGISIFTVITIPYQEAVGLWRGEGNIWAENPQKARPAWINFFLENDLPRKHCPGDSTVDLIEKQVHFNQDGFPEIDLFYNFEYPYQVTPQELLLELSLVYDRKLPFLGTFTWLDS